MFSSFANPNAIRPVIAMIARAECVVAKPEHGGQADTARTGRHKG